MLLAKEFRVAFEIFGFTIYKYAICILIGGTMVLWICQHLAKKDGYPKDLIFDAFLIVFPVGILGARIYYCIANFQEFNSFGQMLDFRNGGLAVQGGVALGCLSGLIYFHKKTPKESLRYWADIIVPNILIAQAIGRWGNFFNDEVYGMCQPIDSWRWVPQFISERMENLCSSPTMMAVPLFLIESLINFLGFLLISLLLRFKWHRGRKLGDLAALYFVWYGVVRLILEPLRNEEFHMYVREGGLPSTMVFSALMVVFGIGMIITNRIFKAKDSQVYEYNDVLDKVEEE